MADLPILDLLLFATGIFAAALVTGIAGFAFGIVAAAAWLHFLPPAQTTALIVAYGLIVQGISVWKLRRSIQLSRLLPFLFGGAIGAPIGVELLYGIPPGALRLSVGIVLIIFSLYSLMRPQFATLRAGLPLLLVGTWVGLRLYTRLDEAGFRRVVLGLLLISGVGLIARGS